MKRWKKAAIALLVSFLFCFMCVGYAVVNDQLNIFGSVSLDTTTSTILERGEIVNTALKGYPVTRVVFDKYVNQSAALSYAGIAWEEGADIHTADSSPGSLKLFWDAKSTTVYILSKNDKTLLANADCAGMFAGITTLKEIVFNCFDTASTANMTQMFDGCTALSTIYAKESFVRTADGLVSDNMFRDCLVLRGGEGTHVYQDSTPLHELDCTRAQIDGENAEIGYFTSVLGEVHYFRSNLLKPQAQAAEYDVNGARTWFTVSNALDSHIFSYAQMEYLITYYVDTGDGNWSIQTNMTESHSFAAGSYQVRKTPVTPITVGETVYNKVKVMATCTSGDVEPLEAVFNFTQSPCTVSYSYASNAITVTIFTNDEGGAYNFAWNAGLTPDASDPYLIFSNVQADEQSLQATLNGRTRYEFYFFVTDDALKQEIADTTDIDTLIQSYVTVSKAEE